MIRATESGNEIKCSAKYEKKNREWMITQNISYTQREIIFFRVLPLLLLLLLCIKFGKRFQIREIYRKTAEQIKRAANET